MSLFPDLTVDPRRRQRRARTGWTLMMVAVLATAAMAAIPAPYVIEKPGPVFDTLGEVETGDGEVALISIPEQRTYPTTGSLSLLTVSVIGNRESLPSWFEVLTARFDSSRAVIPVDEVYPPGLSVDESTEQNRVAMENSQREAVAAALGELGYEFASTLTVVEVQPGRPAHGVLQAGDRILSLNGRSFDDVTGLQQAIAENGTDEPASVQVERDGQRITVSLTPVMSDTEKPAPIVGVLVRGEYEFPFEVDIALENVGGPSAGMMFTLGIIDKLTPGPMTGGEEIAGTGTIDAGGEVGPIGGIRQKLHGAADAGAEWFLAPVENCDQVAGNVPDGLSVVAVDTLDDALAAVEAIAADRTADLPGCR